MKSFQILVFKCKTSEHKGAEWKKKHNWIVLKHVDGTAGAMEFACAENLSKRYVEKHNM